MKRRTELSNEAFVVWTNQYDRKAEILFVFVNRVMITD